MEYECKLSPASTLDSGILNLKRPLCTNCKNSNCSNPIIEKKISIMGVIYTTKLFNIGNSYFFVNQCDGYLKGDDDDEI